MFDRRQIYVSMAVMGLFEFAFVVFRAIGR
jgi:hypothetical protein